MGQGCKDRGHQAAVRQLQRAGYSVTSVRRMAAINLPNCWARPRGRAAAHSHRTALLCEGPHSHSGPNLIHLSGEFWRSRSSFPPSISAWMEAIVVIGAVIALVMVIGSVGVPRAAPVIEQTQDDFRQLPLINRETPPSLETDAPVNDREQLRRYFLQEWRGPPMRSSPR